MRSSTIYIRGSSVRHAPASQESFFCASCALQARGTPLSPAPFHQQCDDLEGCVVGSHCICAIDEHTQSIAWASLLLSDSCTRAVRSIVDLMFAMRPMTC
jgi:hypothetical protein